MTSDNQLVCFHDATLERTTNGSGPVSALPLTELRRLDAGYRHRVNGEFPFRGMKVTVPTLEEMVSSIPESGWVIDLKAEGTAEVLAETITRLGLLERVIVGSFSTERLRRFRELTAYRVPTSTGYEETLQVVAVSAAARFVDPLESTTVALQVPETWYGIPMVTSRTIEFAHSRGRLVHVWTVNHTDDMTRLTALGIDGIITDRPDLLSLR